MAMGTGKSSRVVPLGRRTAVLEVPRLAGASAPSARPQVDEPKKPSDVAASPMFGVAMLKIAMELKKAEPQSLDALISGVLAKMDLDEASFRSYLEANGGLLKAIAHSRRY